MVSIPDWSKLSRLHETAKPKTESSRERYRRQREEETIKQAEDRGYFLVPSESFIIERCATSRRTAPTRRSHFFNEAQTPPDKKIASMKFVKLPNLHIRRIGDISFCTNLRICILSNNFLDKFDALAACRHLVKLDLHSNQITTVPGIAFWSSMNKLKFLHLHDNPLGKFQILNSLAACSRLMVLTMYDTPVSLKKNYRHHVVNSIWSLKALDRHVISDEEIIEDAQFTDRFTTLHPALRIHLCPATPSHSTFKEERRSMLGVLSRISRILAHNSPVIVIQRHIRGFLARRKIARTRPGYSPYFRPIPMGCVGCYEMPHTTSPTAGIAIPTDRTSEAMGMDYDGYLRGRGGGASTITSLDTPLSSSRLVQDLSLTKDDPKSRLLIDLSKLENETLRSLDKVPPGTPASLLPYDTLEETTPPKSQKKAPKPPKEKAKRSQDVKQFFGPVVQDSASDDLTPSTANMYEEELPLIQFRLQGFCPRHRKIDPTTDMILSRRDAARDIRLAEVEHHQQQLLIPRPQIPPQKRINNEQRLFARVHGTMSTTCLFAVQQAYKDRDKSEKMTAKMENIMDQKRERDLAKHRIKMYHEEKRANAIKEREKDKTQILESMERHAMQRMNYLEKRNGQRVVSGDASKSVRADLRFISEFTNQHTSVSKALMRHDRHTRVEDNMHSKNDFVQGQKHTEKAQHETVRKYMEHRQLMRQTESAMMRAALDTRMLQDANERILQAKSRVAQLKARQATVQAFYPLPHVNSSQVTSAPSPSKHNLERWNTNLTTDGRLEGAVH